MEAVFKNWIHGMKFVSSVTDRNATPYRFTEQFFSRLTKFNLHLELLCSFSHIRFRKFNIGAVSTVVFINSPQRILMGIYLVYNSCSIQFLCQTV